MHLKMAMEAKREAKGLLKSIGSWYFFFILQQRILY